MYKYLSILLCFFFGLSIQAQTHPDKVSFFRLKLSFSESIKDTELKGDFIDAFDDLLSESIDKCGKHMALSTLIGQTVVKDYIEGIKIKNCKLFGICDSTFTYPREADVLVVGLIKYKGSGYRCEVHLYDTSNPEFILKKGSNKLDISLKGIWGDNRIHNLLSGAFKEVFSEEEMSNLISRKLNIPTEEIDCFESSPPSPDQPKLPPRANFYPTNGKIAYRVPFIKKPSFINNSKYADSYAWYVNGDFINKRDSVFEYKFKTKKGRTQYVSLKAKNQNGDFDIYEEEITIKKTNIYYFGAPAAGALALTSHLISEDYYDKHIDKDNPNRAEDLRKANHWRHTAILSSIAAVGFSIWAIVDQLALKYPKKAKKKRITSIVTPGSLVEGGVAPVINVNISF